MSLHVAIKKRSGHKSLRRMDKIFIKELKVETIIGILPHERTQKQLIMINLEIGINNLKAASSDKIEDAIDYFSIAKSVTEFVQHSRYGLIETLAEKISELLLLNFPIDWISVEIQKPAAIQNATHAGVFINRVRHPLVKSDR